MKKTIYISAPITGIPEEKVNYIFSKVEDALLECGYNTINPIKICDSSMTYGECMGKDIQELIDNADAIYFCRGWEKSKGCLIEFFTAKIYDKEIMFE